MRIVKGQGVAVRAECHAGNVWQSLAERPATQLDRLQLSLPRLA